MSPNPLTPTPRLLLFPQVGRPEGKDGRPGVRRYSLTLLHGTRPDGRAAGAASAPPRG